MNLFKKTSFDLKGNPKKFWKTTGSIIKGLGEQDVPASLKNLDENAKHELVNNFNSFFCSVGENLAGLCTPLNNSEKEYLGLHRVDPVIPNNVTFRLLEVNSEQVLKVIKDLKTNKSSGFQDIPMFVFKDSCIILVNQLTHILNLSFCQGVFPQSWKNVRITPIFKGNGPIDDPNFYRPISIIPCISKIIEKLFLNQLNKYLNENSLLSNCQNGFRSKHSIHTAINHFLSYVYDGIINDEYIYSCYIDLKKAFDSVNHKLLLNKLKLLFNFDDTVILWLHSFLFNRTQYCKFLDKCSKGQMNPLGVPQGSILGPILFSLFINDCPLYTIDCNIVLYADDTALLMKSKNICELTVGMEKNLHSLSLWLRNNKLNLNAKKSLFTLFNVPKGISLSILPDEINMGPHIIKSTDCYTYLGLDIDRDLNFEKQVNKVIKTCAYRTSQFFRLRPYLSEYTAKIIFSTMILPIIECYSNYYIVCKKRLKDKLNVIFNRGIRVIKKMPKRTNISQAANDLKVLKLEERRLINLICQGYENTKIFSNLDTRNLVTRAHDENRKQLHVIESRKNIFRNCYIYRSIHIWNDLPTCFHIANSRRELVLNLNANINNLMLKYKDGIG